MHLVSFCKIYTNDVYNVCFVLHNFLRNLKLQNGLAVLFLPITDMQYCSIYDILRKQRIAQKYDEEDRVMDVLTMEQMNLSWQTGVVQLE